MGNIHKDFRAAFVGNVGFDHIYQVDEIPTNGDGRSNIIAGPTKRAGGFASHAVNALSFVGSLAIGSVVGDDSGGEELRENLFGIGANAQHVETLSGKKTFENQVFEDSMRRSVYRNGNAEIPWHDAAIRRSLLALATRSEALLVSNIAIEATIDLAKQCRKAQTLFAVCPGGKQLPQIAKLDCDLLCLSVSEARSATGLEKTSTRPARVFQKLIEAAPGAARLVQTAGANPAQLYDRATNAMYEVNAAKLERISPWAKSNRLHHTGAGDTCAAGTLFGLLKGEPLDVAYSQGGRVLATAHLLGREFETLTELLSWRERFTTAFPLPVRADGRRLAA